MHRRPQEAGRDEGRVCSASGTAGVWCNVDRGHSAFVSGSVVPCSCPCRRQEEGEGREKRREVETWMFLRVLGEVFTGERSCTCCLGRLNFPWCGDDSARKTFSSWFLFTKAFLLCASVLFRVCFVPRGRAEACLSAVLSFGRDWPTPKMCGEAVSLRGNVLCGGDKHRAFRYYFVFLP